MIYHDKFNLTFVYKFTNAEKEFIRCNVKSYDALSSREKISAGYLRKLCGREVECVLDPVFLVPASRWNKIAARPPCRLRKITKFP